MSSLNPGALQALLVCPNRELAGQFEAAVVKKGHLQVLEEMETYPSTQLLQGLLRQHRPGVALIDVSQDLETALRVIATCSAASVQVVALHLANDAAVIMRSLRAGGSEFLAAPFDDESVVAALRRIEELQQAGSMSGRRQGKIIAFVGVKAGQGVSTVASNVAAVLARDEERKVLLIDFDTQAGTLSFSWRVTHAYSFLDAMQHADKLDPTLWSALIVRRNDVDILLGPDAPEMPPYQAEAYSGLLSFARTEYDLLILDLPAIYGPQAKAIAPLADRVYVVCNTELASLHLTRKSISHLEQQGVPRSRFSVVLNRLSRRSELRPHDMERVFNFPISKVLPEDESSIYRAVTAGKPVPDASSLGKEIRSIADEIAGVSGGGSNKKKAAAGMGLAALLPQSLT